MILEEYVELIHEDIALATSVNMSTEEEEFLSLVTGILIDAEEFDDFVECYYESVSRRNANLRIDGYSFDETDGSCCIFISDYHGSHGEGVVRSENVNSLFNKIRHFVEDSVNNKLYDELEESTDVYEFAYTLHTNINSISKFRFYLLTDAVNKQRKKNIKDLELFGKIVELNVWDISRIFDIVVSRRKKESIEINLLDLGYKGIPCVKAVECIDVVADIDTFSSLAEPEQDTNKAGNRITYSSYLAVVPGDVLNKLYLEYGSRLLEGNVRSFLSNRGKVNKNIQNTIKNYPEMFFAYNNGIAATASDITTECSSDGLMITKITDLQIVNGGQTTASITNTILNARKDERIDIGKLFVPMKLSVLEHSMSELIIPKISEYSNSQNKIESSDFFSNHPFHIRMEDCSRKTPAPAVRGNQYQQYWFYERTRGQYNQAKIKFKPKSSQLRQFEARYPENQIIKLVDLAKYMELYYGAPNDVSKGKQALVQVFAKNISESWSKNDAEFNQFYFKRVVAIALIFKEADNIIKATSWYKEKHSYKANVIAYTLSILFDFVRTKQKGREVDFLRIWNEQEVYLDLKIQLRMLCTQVYEFITRDDRLIENVTQWCKAKECWERARKETWNIDQAFIDSLVDSELLKSEEKSAKKDRKLDSEVDNLKSVITAGEKYWNAVLSWGKERKLLTDPEISILRLAANIQITGRVPNTKQLKVILNVRERLISEGMPMQFE